MNAQKYTQKADIAEPEPTDRAGASARRAAAAGQRACAAAAEKDGRDGRESRCRRGAGAGKAAARDRLGPRGG